MTNIEQERMAFEAAWRAEYPLHGESAFMRSKIEPEHYVNTRTQDGWLMWQARAQQPSAEPVAWIVYTQDGRVRSLLTTHTDEAVLYPGDYQVPLYARPAAADAPDIHSFDPTPSRAHVTVKWPGGRCLMYRLDTGYYTNTPEVRAAQQPSAGEGAWGNIAGGFKDEDRRLFTDKLEANKYHNGCYDLAPLYTRPAADVLADAERFRFVEGVDDLAVCEWEANGRAGRWVPIADYRETIDAARAKGGAR